MKKAYKIKFKFDPYFQCVLGRWFGWQLLLDAVCNKNDFYYTKPFTYKKNSFDKAVNHIKKNKISIDNLHEHELV